MSYVLGLDAGATKTQCVLANDMQVLARAESGTIKILHVAPAEAQKHLEEILLAVSLQSGIALQAISSTCVGLSGNTIPSVADWVRQALATRVSGRVSLYGDEEIALDAAFHGGAGILVIAGTGSNVIGRTYNGEFVRAGGWGPVLSDQGAGSRIGLHALRAIFYGIDAGETTTLLPAVQAAWKTQTLEDLIDLGNRVSGHDLSQLAPLVARCAGDGDAMARRVLQRAGEELGDLVLLVLRKGFSADISPSAKSASHFSHPTIAFTGSIVKNITLVRESMKAAIHRADPAVVFLPGVVDPVLGAVWRAGNKKS